MKKEIIIALLYIVLIVIIRNTNIIPSVFLAISIFPISILLILWGIKDFLINEHKIIQIFSIYYKILLYVAVLFVALKYPGAIVVSSVALFFVLTYLITILIKGFEQKYISTAILYLKISAFIVFLLSK